MQPEKIGRYEIKSELGRGGMATVYRGYDPLFEREVAVKVLPSELLHSDPQFKMRFEREAKIIASLEHPSVVPVYDVGDDNGQPYFVMRYMNGGSLSERIKAKTMTVEEAVKILGQLAPGMDEAHSKGIIHRDLKPSNILFDSKGVPYIADFGIAKLSQAQSGSMTGSGIIGTPAYMAPEQAQGSEVDGRSDIYAVGIILFEMLTGRQPYEADTPMAVAIKHITDPVPRILDANPKLPPEVEPIIQTAMAKDKKDRFATTGELVDALRTVSSGQKFQSATVKGKVPQAPTVRSNVKIPAAPAKKGFNVWLVIIPVILIGAIGGGIALFSVTNRPVETEAPTQTQEIIAPTNTSEAAPQATETSASVPVVVDTDTPTATIAPATDTPAAPAANVIGGADKIAFVANNELWLMNVDGTDLKQLTTDGASKSDLQWLPGGDMILFISGKTVKFYNVVTDAVDTLTSFPSAVSLDAFQVSHDGKRVMIGMSNEVFVVPFDFETMKTIKTRGNLFGMKSACILPTPKTPAALAVQEARWSQDDSVVAWLFKGVDAANSSLQAEQVGIYNIGACDPKKIDLLDTFPGTRFDPVGYQNHLMPDFDWDGVNQFTFNTARRNDGWGELYIYNWENHKPTLLYPVSNKCCYRDARWSPDGTYLLFEFQDQGLAQAAQTTLYYVQVGELNTGANFIPIQLPEGFFRNPKEGMQAALRPVKP